MKPFSLPSRKILLICFILLCGVAAVIGGLCLSKEPRITEGSFFEIAGFSVDVQIGNDWFTFQQEGKDDTFASDAPTDGMDEFVISSIQSCLSGTEAGNQLYSPLNMYLSLSLLAEATDGDSRQQILDVLGNSDIETLREQATSTLNANYADNGGKSTSVPSNSLWFDESLSITDSSVQELAETYSASAYRGKLGSLQVNRVLQSWILDQSRGFIQDWLIQDVTLFDGEDMALASTMYLNYPWETAFPVNTYSEETFCTPTGEVTCEFMHQASMMDYYWGSSFTAVSKPLASEGEVLLILPNEDASIDSLLTDPEVMDLIVSDLRGNVWANHQNGMINFSIPKFMITSNVDLAEDLHNMGITNIFDEATADFSPISDGSSNVHLSQIIQSNRVVINPNGCVSEYEDIDPFADTTFHKEDGIDLVFDRPFLFVITGNDGMPVLAGIVNEPEYIQRSISICYE